MVRTLTPTLAAAVSARTHLPVVTLSAEDHISHLQQNIATAANSDTWFDACIASDGSIIRVKVTNSGGTSFTRDFQFQRITDPAQASQWTGWTSFTGGTGNMHQNGGVAVSNNSGTLRAFAQQGTGGNALFVWTSSNNGVSWTGPVTVLSPPLSALTRGLSSSGNNDLFLLYDVPAANQLGCSFFSGGVWSALHVSTLPTIPFVGSHTGIAAVWNGSSYTVIYSDGTALKSDSVSSSGATWTKLFVDVASASNQNIQRVAPRVAFFDGLYHLACVEIDNGINTGTIYQYPRVRQSADLIHWSSGFLLHDMTTAFGGMLLKTTPPGLGRARYVAITHKLIESGQDYQQSDPANFSDLSTKILSYHREETIGKAAKIEITLDNTGAALNGSVATYGSTYAPIGLNTTLVLGEGYRTGTPPTTPEAVTVARYHVRKIAFQRAPGQSLLHIEAEDLSRLLDRANRYQVTYSNQALSFMVTEICARAGLFSVALPLTAQMSINIVTFVLHAGQHFRDALDELCRLGWLEYFLDQDETLQFRELAPGDPIAWTYAPEIETLVLANHDQQANHVIVSGQPPTGITSYFGALTNGEAYDDTHMHITGLEHVITSSDPRLQTSLQCASKAAFILQQQQRAEIAHTITVPANPALQLLDVLALSDQAQPRGTGISANARIQSSTVHFNAQQASFEQVINLEGV